MQLYMWHKQANGLQALSIQNQGEAATRPLTVPAGNRNETGDTAGRACTPITIPPPAKLAPILVRKADRLSDSALRAATRPRAGPAESCSSPAWTLH